MRNFLLGVLLATSLQAAESYHCELKARTNFMLPFVSTVADFDGDRPIELHNTGFRMRFQTVLVQGEHRLAMSLGMAKDHSSVTMGRVGDKEVYLNFLSGENFAVAQCTLK